jgi:hypothetical protein
MWPLQTGGRHFEELDVGRKPTSQYEPLARIIKTENTNEKEMRCTRNSRRINTIYSLKFEI